MRKWWSNFVERCGFWIIERTDSHEILAGIAIDSSRENWQKAAIDKLPHDGSVLWGVFQTLKNTNRPIAEYALSRSMSSVEIPYVEITPEIEESLRRGVSIPSVWD